MPVGDEGRKRRPGGVAGGRARRGQREQARGGQPQQTDAALRRRLTGVAAWRAWAATARGAQQCDKSPTLAESARNVDLSHLAARKCDLSHRFCHQIGEWALTAKPDLGKCGSLCVERTLSRVISRIFWQQGRASAAGTARADGCGGDGAAQRAHRDATGARETDAASGHRAAERTRWPRPAARAVPSARP